jgi:nucleotide-binding universal stress UspA family protein
MTMGTTTATQSIANFSSVSYTKILVPHDGSQMSDKALAHAAYISKISGGQIDLVHVLEHAKDIPPSTILALISPDKPLDKAKEDLKIIAEAEARKMLEEKVNICKEEGKIDQVSYKIETGKPVDEIVRIVVMGSSRISSSIRLLGSTAKGVIDSIQKPVLIIHG